ncbi:acyl carrier protein [Thiobacillus sp. 0-1251]|mgnify:CR=1 FL=1|uniref:acyl carrier protein n=1 Tax=Thiobacillus sp. 0-1251 TaxID=1895858 RepID=UPI0025E4B1DE|nr:acyl carrier protein [Thiobacillus sp. 0-1251]
MSTNAILEKVQHIIAESLDLEPSKILSGQSFRRDLGADSLDSVEIVMAIEERFGVEFDEETVAKVDTVADLVGHIEATLARKCETPA